MCRWVSSSLTYSTFCSSLLIFFFSFCRTQNELSNIFKFSWHLTIHHASNHRPKFFFWRWNKWISIFLCVCFFEKRLVVLLNNKLISCHNNRRRKRAVEVKLLKQASYVAYSMRHGEEKWMKTVMRLRIKKEIIWVKKTPNESKICRAKSDVFGHS